MIMKFRPASSLASKQRKYLELMQTSLRHYLKQIVTYVPYYEEKALSDSDIIGLPITLANFNDGIMETAHKQNKKNSLLFSGGWNGPISKHQYQKQVIQQQFANEVFELICRELNHSTEVVLYKGWKKTTGSRTGKLWDKKNGNQSDIILIISDKIIYSNDSREIQQKKWIYLI